MIWNILYKIWKYFFISECERCDLKLNSKTKYKWKSYILCYECKNKSEEQFNELLYVNLNRQEYLYNCMRLHDIKFQ